jgi:hypothetical protein
LESQGEPLANEKHVAALISAHVQRYPEIDVSDVYKLLHQAVFGPGHAIKNQKAAREWLERESEILKPVSGEPLVESIHPESAVVRVHLRPYLAARGSLTKLLAGFVQSAAQITGDPAIMAAWWRIFEHMLAGPLASRFDPRDVVLLRRTREREGWPAMQHSPRFDRLYHPAYRVLASSVAEALLRQQNMAFSPA